MSTNETEKLKLYLIVWYIWKSQGQNHFAPFQNTWIFNVCL